MIYKATIFLICYCTTVYAMQPPHTGVDMQNSSEEISSAPKNEAPANPLHRLASQGNNQLIKHYIEKGFDVNGLTENGNSPLWFAFLSKRISTIELLRRRGARVDLVKNKSAFKQFQDRQDFQEALRALDEELKPEEKKKETKEQIRARALRRLRKLSWPAIIDYKDVELVRAGLKLHEPSHEALDYAFLLVSELELKNVKEQDRKEHIQALCLIIHEFFKTDAQLLKHGNAKNASYLHRAVVECCSEVVDMLLLNAPWLLPVADVQGNTALQYALEYNRPQALEVILRHDKNFLWQAYRQNDIHHLEKMYLELEKYHEAASIQKEYPLLCRLYAAHCEYRNHLESEEERKARLSREQERIQQDKMDRYKQELEEKKRKEEGRVPRGHEDFAWAYVAEPRRQAYADPNPQPAQAQEHTIPVTEPTWNSTFNPENIQVPQQEYKDENIVLTAQERRTSEERQLLLTRIGLGTALSSLIFYRLCCGYVKKGAKDPLIERLSRIAPVQP